MQRVLSTTTCCVIVSTPHRAASAGRLVHVRDQREQQRQFTLCNVRDDHSEGAAGGSDVRKQASAVVRMSRGSSTGSFQPFPDFFHF